MHNYVSQSHKNMVFVHIMQWSAKDNRSGDQLFEIQLWSHIAFVPRLLGGGGEKEPGTHHSHMRVVYPDFPGFRIIPFMSVHKRHLCTSTLYPSAIAWPEGSSVHLKRTLANEPKPRIFYLASLRK